MDLFRKIVQAIKHGTITKICDLIYDRVVELLTFGSFEIWARQK